MVAPLAETLRAAHLEVWYDDFVLEVGDSIRRALDRGLTTSRYGVVVLSPAFFAKQWPQYELDGLIEREMRGQDKVILPVWHGVTHDEVSRVSPALAARKAVTTDGGVDEVAKALLRVLRPTSSPLIVARDMIIEAGMSPPPITSEYWLQVVEASNRMPATGAVVPDEATWGMWSFPLPEKDQGWGERLAWTAMQLSWVRDAETSRITPVSPPDLVLAFIQRNPGLLETCQEFPDLVAEYAPQLTIPGLGGVLEPYFDQRVIEISAKGKLDDEWCLRDLGSDRSASDVAYAYFHGGLFGPRVSPYHEADHLFWVLSSASSWLPRPIRRLLREGLKAAPWPWGKLSPKGDRGPSTDNNGTLLDALRRLERAGTFLWTEAIAADVEGRAAATAQQLNLPETPTALARAFRRHRFPEAYVRAGQDRHVHFRELS